MCSIGISKDIGFRYYKSVVLVFLRISVMGIINLYVILVFIRISVIGTITCSIGISKDISYMYYKPVGDTCTFNRLFIVKIFIKIIRCFNLIF